MLKKSHEQKEEARKNMRGGPGEVMFKHYFSKDEIAAPCRLCAQLTLPPGAGIGLHDHTEEDEIFIIQQGKGLATCDGKEMEVEAGDSLLTGGGSSHSIQNTGDKDLIITAVVLMIFVYRESQRFGMGNWWVYIVATLTIGPSFAFPLFLYFRESQVEALASETKSQPGS